MFHKKNASNLVAPPPIKNKAHDSKHEDEEVNQNQIQQWVDRAIGNQSILTIEPRRLLETETMDGTNATGSTYQVGEHSFPIVPPTSLKATIENPHATQSDFDRALAAELNQLSFEERERTWDEIHGVAPIQKETPEFLNDKLDELKEVIASTPLDKKKMYVEALNDPKGQFYVTSPQFQLQFLRAERFDVTKAATRLLLCCEKKVQFFGRPSLNRPLRLSDLNADERKTLKGGAFQVLSQRDRSGRLIVIDTSLCGPKLYTSLFAYYKCFWYIIMSAIEDDEETQQRGIVAVVWWMHHRLRLDQDFDNELRQETIQSLKWLPMRPYSSTHLCIDHTHSAMKQILARFMMAVSPKDMRYGIQLHRGTHTEVMYKLLTYGIPVDIIPVTSSGIVKTKDFGRWIQRRQTKDDYLFQRIQVNPSDLLGGSFLQGRIELPSNRDVLLGTGKPLMKHPGNQNFRDIVNGLLNVYDSTVVSKDKAELTWGVVRLIQKDGGRFLKREKEGDWWVLASDQEARDKTGKAFVNHRGNSNSKNKNKRSSRIEELETMRDSKQAAEEHLPIRVGLSQLIDPRDVKVDGSILRSNKKRREGDAFESRTLNATSCFGWCGPGLTVGAMSIEPNDIDTRRLVWGHLVMDPSVDQGESRRSPL